MRHVEHDAAVPGGGDSDAFRCDEAPRRLDARDRASRITPDSRNLAIFDDVDAERIGGAGIAPGDRVVPRRAPAPLKRSAHHRVTHRRIRSEEHTSELQSLMRLSYAVFCLKKKTLRHTATTRNVTR